MQVKPRSRRFDNGLSRAGFTVIAGLLLVFATSVQAQVQRTFVNPSFEQPNLGTTACVAFATDAQVPGWSTTHPSGTSSGCTLPAATGPLIELWANNFNSVPARVGNNHAELNASQASRIYQTVCLVNGETINWRFSHRGRQSATIADVMDFNIGPTATGTTTRIVQASDANDGNPGAASMCITGGTCSRATGPNGWGDYSGSFTWNSGTGSQTIGFEAISSQGGISVGNFLDDIQITLQPYIEFSSSTYQTVEGATINVPVLQVTGTVPTGGITVPIVITGTATLGQDYTTASGTNTINVTIPAGVYDSNTFNLTMSSLQDTVIENNETLVLTIQPSTGYVLTSTVTCGGTANNNVTWTLLDDDVDLRASKSVSNATPAGGVATTFTVTFENNTAATLLAPTTSHNAVAAVSDAIPSGLTFTSWTCVASNGASCPGGTTNGTTSGTGAISGNATLPAGNAAAGGRVVYTITATPSATQCTAVTNTATITTPSALNEGTSVQTGFVSPAPGGAANNTAQASVDPVCSNLSLTKTNTPGSGATDQTNDTVTRGTSTVYSIVVSNNGPDAANNAVLRDPAPSGLNCTAVSCGSATGGAICPVSGTGAGQLSVANLQSGGGVVLPIVPANSSLTVSLTCTVL
ncbi:DUF11 domain-containing protein [Luteimonas panaciterrae]|uniref:DUF11 domain-containing protein n=1 Tax=Luteimonas panaciterrae TaxID=363885 RepID=UPI001CFB0518|nr:DUF11 domain-containing protein [Luteimonas panaciterrae]